MKSRNKTILSALSVAALAGSLLAGCGTGASSTQGTDPAQAASNNTAEAPKSKFPEKPI
ncbi:MULTISPECIES: hypothetical protein [unclassified Paenibacillus]|uniref:hypothetical protein n=1 Tax=unclassified Paenibacillus TaxID=185978 RepID=UPI00211912C0|nr:MULTISPECIES: hypothetical protein [unclassified Paenibacillus]